jgi:hypothetical protein
VRWVENLTVRNHFGDTDTDRRLILKWFFNNIYMVQGCKQDVLAHVRVQWQAVVSMTIFAFQKFCDPLMCSIYFDVLWPCFEIVDYLIIQS